MVDEVLELVLEVFGEVKVVLEIMVELVIEVDVVVNVDAAVVVAVLVEEQVVRAVMMEGKGIRSQEKGIYGVSVLQTQWPLRDLWFAIQTGRSAVMRYHSARRTSPKFGLCA
jgi:hypothetical protein